MKSRTGVRYIVAIVSSFVFMSSTIALSKDVPAQASVETTETSLNVAPSPLLAVEQNRASIVERIISAWRAGLAQSYGDATPDKEAQLRAALMGLRADRLLSASLVGTLDGLAKALDANDKSGLQATTQKMGGVIEKQLGDATQDLLFTPVTPCRIADTRVAGGALTGGVMRTFIGYNATTFASQGGVVSNCSVPNGVAALVLNISAVQPAAAGFLRLWPANLGMPFASMVNFAAGDFAIATGTIVPVDSTTNNQFDVWSPVNVDFVADVAGYFAKPNVTPLDCVTTNYSSVSIVANGAAQLLSPACPTAYTVVGGSCFLGSSSGFINTFLPSGNAWQCYAHAPATLGDMLSVAARCCRIPGR